MDYILMTLKILFLFLAVRYTFVNLGQMYYKNTIPSGNTFWMAVGIVGFIVLQFDLWKL